MDQENGERVKTCVAVHLVGGPYDGEWYLARHGQLFIHLMRGEKEHAYGLGDDGKYHYCPEIEEGDTSGETNRTQA
jgi:hypothetical protein